MQSRVISLIMILHSRLDHRKRNLHMNRRTLVFKYFLNRCLNSYRREAQQFMIDEFLNFDLKRVTILNRMPYISDMISTYGIGIMLGMIGNPSRLDLFRRNFPNVNLYRQQMCISNRNLIIIRTCLFLIVVLLVGFILLQILIASSRPLMWQQTLFLRGK